MGLKYRIVDAPTGHLSGGQNPPPVITLDTMGRGHVEVSWETNPSDPREIRPTSVVLAFRVGTNGNFHVVATPRQSVGNGFNGREGGNRWVQVLPANVENHPYIEVTWLNRNAAGRAVPITGIQVTADKIESAGIPAKSQHATSSSSTALTKVSLDHDDVHHDTCDAECRQRRVGREQRSDRTETE